MKVETNNRALNLKDRLSYKQAKSSVLIAFVLGILISLFQIYWDFQKESESLDHTMMQVLKIVEQTASQSAYTLDKGFAKELINGLFEYNPIYEASIKDDADRILASVKSDKEEGRFNKLIYFIFGADKSYTIPLKILPPPTNFIGMQEVITVGELSVKADTYQIGVDFLQTAAVIFVSGIIRNVLLASILFLFFYYYLTKPFLDLESELTTAVRDNPEKTRLRFPRGHTKDEFSRLVTATNQLLHTIQSNIEERIRKIGETERLKGEISERKKREEELRKIQNQLEESNVELNVTLKDLQKTQVHLVQSEKMAALGELVASIAHEVNTPLGIGVTGVTYLQDEVKQLKKLYAEDRMRRSDLEEFMENSEEITEMLNANIRRAADLIKSFKQMAVDQASEEKRPFKAKEYTEEILRNLGSKLQKAKQHIEIKCDEDLYLESYPGAFSQIITNLTMNALIHAFEEEDEGAIRIEIQEKNDYIDLIFSDDGKGVQTENLERIFEPFFTTKRNLGGSGLGLHIVYNNVVKGLSGDIRCESKVGEGTKFLLSFPRVVN